MGLWSIKYSRAHEPFKYSFVGSSGSTFLVYRENAWLMILFDGKRHAETIREALREEIRARNLVLKLAVVQVGSHPATVAFVQQKRKFAEHLGVGFEVFSFPAHLTHAKLLQAVEKIVADKEQ